MGLFDDLLEEDELLQQPIQPQSQQRKGGLFDDLLEEDDLIQDTTLQPSAPAAQPAYQYDPSGFRRKKPVVAEPKPEEQGILRQVADIPLGIARGGVTGIKMMTDILGADNPVSKSLSGVEGYMADLMSAQAKEDQQEISRIMKDAEDKGFGEQVKAGIKAFSIAPVDIMSQALGTMAPVIATGLAGSAAKLGALGMRAVQAGVGAGMGAGMIKGEIYNEVKNELVNSGIAEDAAEKAAVEAQSYGGKNLDQILLGAGLGAASTLGAEGIITRILTKQGTAPAAGVVSRVLKGGLTEAAPEAAQAAQEQLAKNVALQREGFDVDPSRGVVAAATMEAVAAAPLGGIAGAVERPAPIKTLAEENLEQTNEIARKVAENGAPLTASAIQDQAATNLRQDELAKQLEAQLEEELVAVKEPTAAAQKPMSKDEFKAIYSQVAPEELDAAEAGFTRDLATATTEEARANAQNALEAIKEVKATVTPPAPTVEPTITPAVTPAVPTAQPPITDATKEIIQPEGVRQEPQDRVEVRPTEEAGVSRGVFDTTRGQEEGQVVPTAQPIISEKPPTSELVGAEPAQPTIREVPEISPIVGEEPAAIVEQEPVAPAEPKGTRVAAAAYIAPDGTQYTGPSHLAAMEQAKNEGKITQAEIDAKQAPESRETPQFGYKTDAEPFVTRDQAEGIARQSGQLLVEKPATGQLHSNEVALDEFPKEAAVAPAPVEEAEFAELNDLMERRGQAQSKVKGVKFSKKDEVRYNELLPKYRSRLIETVAPESDPVVWKDIEGNDIKVSSKGTFYTVRDGRVRTGVAFQPKEFAADVSPQPVSATVVESNNVQLPEGYTKQGDLYVYQPAAAPTPVTTPPVTEAVTPAPEAAPTPAGISVGNRIKLGKSPQTYTIEEVIPQSATERELGEQYYSVKNERTGETQVVEARDLRQVKGKGARKIAAETRSLEDQIAFEIASDYLDFAEEMASKNRTPFKITGNEQKMVRGFKEELSAKVINQDTGEPDTTHPSYQKWKALQTKAGSERVASSIKGNAIRIIKSNQKKYSKLVNVMGVPLEERFQPTSPDIRRQAIDTTPEGILITPPDQQYTFEEVFDVAYDMFGGEIPEGFTIVNDSKDKDFEFKAAYIPESGEIIVNLAYLNKNDDIRDAITHELGHYIYGDPEFRAAFDQFIASLSPEARADLDAYVDTAYNKETGEIRLEEKMVRAFVDQFINEEQAPMWRSMLDAIKRFLNKLGFKFNISDRDAISVFTAALDRYKAGEAISREGGARKIIDDLTAMDAEYLAAVERGDMETAQRMVDEAAKKAGYAIDSYHGTNGDLFTIFSTERGGEKTFAESARLGIFSTDNPDVAQTYAENIGAGGTFALGLGQGPLTEARDRAISTPEFKALSQAKDAAEKEYSAASKRIYDQYLEAEKAQLQSARGAFKSMRQDKTEAEIDQFMEEIAESYAIRQFSKDEAVNKNPELIAAQEKINEAAKAINDYIYPFLLESLPNVRVMKLKLQIKNPKVYDAQGQTPADFSLSDKIQEAKDLGHDGVIFENIIDPQLPATHYVVFEPQQIKSADPVTYDDAGDVIPLSQRFRPTSPDIRRMAAEPRREQFAGMKIGRIITTPPGITQKTTDIIRAKFFDSTKVSPENTSQAWAYISQFMDKTDNNNNKFAGYVNTVTELEQEPDFRVDPNDSLGAALLSIELTNYAARLAQQGNTKMLAYMIRNGNKMPTGEFSGGASLAGKVLNSFKERLGSDISGVAAFETEMKSNVERLAAKLFGTNAPSAEQIKIAQDALTESETIELGDANQVAADIKEVEGRTKTNLIDKIDAKISQAIDKSGRIKELEGKATRPRNIDAQAESVIESLQRSLGELPPLPQRRESDIRAIVKQDLRQNPDMGRREPWNNMLVGRLMQSGVSEEQAQMIADLTWKQHEQKAINRELKEMRKAAEEGSLAVIIDRIKNTSLERQQSPEWKQEVIKEYLRDAGLSSQAAETAAKLYDSVISERIAAAKQKAFEDTLAKAAPWKNYASRNGKLAKDALKKIKEAIRTGVLDPEKNTESIIAALSGWTGFTKEQYQRIVELDTILNDPNQDDITKREAMDALNKIITKAKMPVRFKDALGAYYIGNALMGIPTALVNIASPLGFSIRNLMVDIAKYAKENPAKIPVAFETFLDSMRSWYNQTAYAFKNQIYLNDVVEYLNGQNVLRETFDKGKKQWAEGKYAQGFANMAVGMTQITGRVLSALDQGAISMLENQNITRYAMSALENAKNKVPKNKVVEFANMTLDLKRRVMMESIAAGMDKDRAGVLADLAVKSELRAALSEYGADTQSVLDSAINDALQSVGRNKVISINGIKSEQQKLSDSGMLSYWPIKMLEKASEGVGSEGSGMQIFAKMVYGFALVPARTFHTAAWFSPYGFLRLAIDKYKKNKGYESPYAMSVQTDAQFRQRLTESIAGSIAMLGLFALRSGSSDEDEDKKFKIVITGNGPNATTDKQYYDSWIKKYKPYSIHIVVGDTVFPINIGRGGEALFFPIMLAGALDDYEIKKKQNLTKKEPSDLNVATEMLGSAFFALAQRGPYAAFTEPLFDASKQGRVTENLVGQLGYFGKTFVPVLGASITRNISDFINDPVDRSSIEGALYANTPMIGPWIGTKALNALGQPIRADDFSDKLFKLGVPVVFSFPKNTPENALNELILKQGSGPTLPTRANAQKRFGDVLTDKEFETYVREYGRVMSDKMFKNRTRLANMKAVDYDDELEKYARGYSIDGIKIKGASDSAVLAVKRMRQ